MREIETMHLETGRERLIADIIRLDENRDYTFSGFVADQRIMDQLLHETSALSPGEHNALVDMGIAIADVIEQKYGKYIPEQVLDQSIGVVDRIICMKPDVYDVFSKEWQASDKTPNKSVGSFNRFLGRVVAIEHPTELLQSVDMMKPEVIEQFGGKREIYKKILTVYFTNILSHEILHEYHPIHPQELMRE